MKRHYLADPIFGFGFLLVVGGLEADAIKAYQRKFNLGPAEGHIPGTNKGCFACNREVEYSGLIWVEKKASASTIAHEAAHATAHVCRVLSLDPREADEFQASYTGWLVRNLTRLYYRKAK